MHLPQLPGVPPGIRRDWRTAAPWAYACLLLVLTAVATRRPPTAPLSSLLRVAAAVPGSPPLRLAIVLQSGDCESRQTYLSHLGRYDVRSVAPVVAFQFVGTDPDSARLRSLLPPEHLATPIAYVDSRTERSLNGLGYTVTPLLLGFDRGGRLVFSRPVPQSELEARAMLRHIAAYAPEHGGSP